MNETEARSLQALVESAAERAFAAGVESACKELQSLRAELRDFRDEMRPMRETVASLEGLLGTVETLSNQYLELTAAIDPLKPLPTLIAAHREDIREHRIKLGYLEGLGPKLDRCNILVDELVPRVERALQLIDVNRNDHAELRQSFTDLEEANGGRRSSIP